MREIHCEDALAWLATYNGAGAIVSRPPGPDAIGPEAFSQVLAGCFAVGNPAALYLTDFEQHGLHVSAAEMAFHIARHIAGVDLVWHKIALHDFDARPGYSHVLAFGRDVTAGQATPDVFDRGTMLYPNATGLVAARMMVEFAGKWAQPIIDPFCGYGTVPAVAEALGYDAIGIDIDPEMCERARNLKLELA
jgi:hypothetical protein